MARTIPTFAILLLVLVGGLAHADAMRFEAEPNETPETAQAVTAPALLAGDLPGNDQDGFRWTVDDVAAQQRWTLRLDGVAGRLTVLEFFRLRYAGDGVTLDAADKQFTIGSRDGSAPAIARDLLLEPGTYLLGVASSGSGGAFRPPADTIAFDTDGGGEKTPPEQDEGYRLRLEQGSKTYLYEHRAGASREEAYALRLRDQYATYREGSDSWYAFELDEENASQNWLIEGQVPVGREVSVKLMDAADEVLAETRSDKLGQFRFVDLGLEPGRYLMELSRREGGMIEVLSLTPTGIRAVGAEAEPNDDWPLANLVDFSSSVTGRLAGSGDADRFRFTMDETGSDRVHQLQVEGTDRDQQIELCLLDDLGKRLQCRRGAGGVTLDNLGLAAGEWGVSIDRGKEFAYELTLRAGDPVAPGQELEPNETLETASAVPSKNRIKGTFSGGGRDTDHFRFTLSDTEPQLWRFQAIGDGLQAIYYYDASGRALQEFRAARGQRRLTLENLFLLPGVHHVAVRGQSGGSYTLLARPLGAPDPNGELEPNDDDTRVQVLKIGQTRTGLLQDRGDADLYRFHLGAEEHVRLTVEPPTDGDVKTYLYWDDREIKTSQKFDQTNVLEALLPPGDYQLRLSTDTPSDAEYRLALERLDRFGCARDCEPNDHLSEASSLPKDHRIAGRAGDWRDDDWYVLPAPDRETRLEIRNLTERWPSKVELFLEGSDENLLQDGETPDLRRATLPAGEPAWVRIDAWGNPEYDLQLAFDPGPEAKRHGTHPDLHLALQPETERVAAFRPFGQRVNAMLTVENRGDRAETLALKAVTSDGRWTTALEPDLTIDAGESRDVPIEVRVPDDAVTGRPIRISVAAIADSGLQASAFMDIRAEAGADDIGARHHWPLPEELLGGFNVAWEALGGLWTDGHDDAIGTGFEYLFNGMAVPDNGLRLRGGRSGPAVVTVDLAGEEPVEVVGITLNLLSEYKLPRLLAEAELSLSQDGQTFTPVLREPLRPVKSEQAFLLEQPMAARFARLTLRNNFHGEDIIGLGEWKVITRPGYDLTGGAGLNLLEPALGGHVAWARPTISRNWDRAILTEAQDTDSPRVKSGNRLEWVVGFHHGRAARLERLEWLDQESLDPKERMESVTVWTSLDSPLGPWSPLGRWTLSADQSPKRWQLPEPVWARYVRFASGYQESRTDLAPPETLRIFESPAGPDYRSIVGEWGMDHRAAQYESLQPLQQKESESASGNNTRQTAAPLAPGKAVSGKVQLGIQEDWYALTAPEGDNVLTLTMTAEPTLRTRLRLENETGESLPLTRLESKSARAVYEATVVPGASYFLVVEEPPRNVVFAWDTSGSVAPFVPIIYQGLAAYAEGVVPGRDAVNLMPFGSDLLLQEWYSEPYMLRTTLNEYPRRESSSSAETTLHDATRALADREGTRAIVLITDAATPRDSAMWDAFAATRPRIFSVGMSSAGALGGEPAQHQDLLQDWAAVNGGHYQYVIGLKDMDTAFERAVTLLRAPAPYALSMTTEFRKDPGPGELVVLPAQDETVAASSAVELILDASGSMLQRLQGERRIEIARQVLTHAVNEVIPAGTPLALRVFGHREPNACRTDLEIPLQPLDPAAAAGTIDAIQARNLARTPIADSLAKVEEDLAGAKGARIVILVTDGEETCEGDPAKVLETLATRGVDLRLNIVGFAIDDEALRDQFQRWATQGGGRYFDATDSTSLQNSVANALRAPFTVLDADGEAVATGVVGGAPLELAPGRYRVLVAGQGTDKAREIEIVGGKQTELGL